MITKIIMIFMILPCCDHAYNHGNHYNH